MQGFSDLALLSEDERVNLIGKTVVKGEGKIIGFAVETRKKANRYVKKIQKKFKEVRVVEIVDNSPTKGVVLVQLTKGDLQ